MAENNGCACMPSSNVFIPYNSATSNVYYSGLLSPQPPPFMMAIDSTMERLTIMMVLDRDYFLLCWVGS